MLCSKKRKPDKTEEPSASQTFGQRDLLRLCKAESATWRLFSAKAGKGTQKLIAQLKM